MSKPFDWLLLPVLYAEIHYTLMGLSLIYRRWPEMLADAPYRVEPGVDVPVLLFVKDAHRFPVTIIPPRIELQYSDGTSQILTAFDEAISITTPIWTRIIQVRPPESFTGTLKIRVHFRVVRTEDGRMRSFVTDNYPGSSRSALNVHIPNDPFPCFPGWILGDLHVHSVFTSDQVEFGAPLDAIAIIGEKSGLRFAAVTDHSYDLDDADDDYLKRDDGLRKFNGFLRQTGLFNGEKTFCLIPGEEVSCGNRFGMNVHLLILNQRSFVAGSGDSAERWFRTKPEHRITDILDAVEDQALTFAAHPEVPFPPLHWIFLRRWKWTRTDYMHHRLDGLQVLNGQDDFFFRKGMKSWVRALLRGTKLSIVAGNDSHGNFNRFRQLLLPFLSIRESDRYVFGKARTAVFTNGRSDRRAVLDALRSGRSMITTGPAIRFQIMNEMNGETGSGASLTGSTFVVHAEALSSEEFGALESIRIHLGRIGNRKEELLMEWRDFQNPYRYEMVSSPFTVTEPSYVRCEASARHERSRTFCMTNPVWLDTVAHDST